MKQAEINRSHPAVHTEANENLNNKSSKYSCPIEATLDLIGGKYKSIILWRLINGTLRFNELSKVIPQATPKMLTQQLRELENDGLVNRVVYPVIPPKVEYSLSDFGKSIIPILDSMCTWGTRYLKDFECD
ncbi:winged helix-turn-helix transcriptional regulator [Anaerocolumna sp. MB42-C2]|uniref:winged helix-turn-helix transcriptional regulator n=1 Tax=Anaerocolumna sp. MB42-C2 TaxID=3070997 RepID=UPI0027E19341|nr:helix-turn-helix domain-containing protein [Anaerocolumna sp. MB42-C2]WMJ87217.1 helix-turn-helix domain-containing protein [Anaerocolumna sp. MB42-C2]